MINMQCADAFPSGIANVAESWLKREHPQRYPLIKHARGTALSLYHY